MKKSCSEKYQYLKLHCTRHGARANDVHSHNIKFTTLWNSFDTMIFDGRSWLFVHSVCIYYTVSSLVMDTCLMHSSGVSVWCTPVLYFIALQELGEYSSKADTSLTQRQMLLQDGHWPWRCAFKENWLYIMKSFYFPDLCHAVEQKTENHINLTCNSYHDQIMFYIYSTSQKTAI